MSYVNRFTHDDIKLLKPAFQATSPDNLNLGFGEIFYGFARALRPRHVVVIGSKAGFAPIVFAKALKENNGYGISEVGDYFTKLANPDVKPSLHFIDPGYNVNQDGSKAYGGEGVWQDPQKVKELWKHFGVDEIVTHHRMTSEEYLQKLPGMGVPKIDILYVDGDHSFEGVTHDLIKFHPYLSASATVIAHDVHPDIDPSHGCGGYQAIHSLPNGLYQGSWLRVMPGLAILQKLEKDEPRIGVHNKNFERAPGSDPSPKM